jgi:endoglucanase
MGTAHDVVVENPTGGGSATMKAGFTFTTSTRRMLRGTNLCGMEGGYKNWPAATGPVADTNYPVHSTKMVDYLVSRGMNVLRLLFSWERMQSALGGPVPAASSGNYKDYFDNFKRVVDYATSKGMTVLVAPWQASSSGGAGGACYRGAVVGSSGGPAAAMFADFWAKLAARLGSNPLVWIGLVNEPNNTDTMQWFSIAQTAINAIRGAGFKGRIVVPGNGWTNASTWEQTWYDTNATKRSNAYGWLNANGVGKPLSDPLGNLALEVHLYSNADAGGTTAEVVSGTIARERTAGVVTWARAHGVKIFVGEVGMYAGSANAPENWASWNTFVNANSDVVLGWAWWAAGKPGWWDDVAANNGGHFSITPKNDYSTDTVNMTMIKPSLSATV